MGEMIQVLFVEDNEADAEIFSKMLTRNHSNRMDLFHVGTLAEALNLLTGQRFDLILQPRAPRRAGDWHCSMARTYGLASGNR